MRGNQRFLAGLGLASVLLLNGLLFSLHHWAAMWTNRGDYTPFAVTLEVSSTVFDETQLYAPGAAKFARSGYLGTELDLVELRQKKSGYPIFHAIVIGALARLFGSVEVGWMLSHAIFPSLVWWLYYRLGRKLLADRLAAAAFAWSCCFIPFGPRSFFMASSLAATQPLDLTRMPHPALSYLVLFLALLLLDWAMQPDAPFWRAPLTGLFSGLLFYCYYFYFVAFFLGLGFWLALALVYRPQDCLRLIAHGCAAALSGGEYLLRMLQASRTGEALPMMRRVGVFGRHVEWPWLAIAVGGLAVLWLAYRRYAGETRWSIAIPVGATAVAGMIGLNLHVLTGYDPQHGHFVNRVIEPLTFLLAAAGAFHVALRRLSPRAMRAVCWTTIVMLLGIAAYRQVKIGVITANSHRASEPRMDALLWVRHNLPADTVTGTTDDVMSTMTPAVTAAWNFVPLGDRTMAPSEEILQRFLIAARLEGRDWPAVNAHLHAPSPIYHDLLGVEPAMLQDAPRIWSELQQPNALKSRLASRRLDYLIVDRSAATSFGQVVYQNPDWRVVRLTAYP